jgi:hypothetical protein
VARGDNGAVGRKVGKWETGHGGNSAVGTIYAWPSRRPIISIMIAAQEFLLFKAPTASLFLFSIVLLWVATHLLRRVRVAFFTELARIPGPFLCHFTDLADTYYALSGHRSEWIHSLHERYGMEAFSCFVLPLSLTPGTLGPVVRISPTLVSVADPAAIKVVYSGKFPKSYQRYAGKRLQGIDHALIFIEPTKAKARRGILLPLFQRQNLEAFEPELNHFVDELLTQITEEQAGDGTVDLFRWYRLVAFDIICEST